MKYIDYLRKHFKDTKSPVVQLYELKAVMRLKGISDSYLWRLVNYLTERGELKHITRGVYSLHDDIVVVGFAFKPFYYGLENALTIRKIWEQGTNPIIITTKSVRSGVRKFEGGNYTVIRTNKRLFFGYELVKYYDFWIPVSDYEKTLIDFVHFNHHLSKGALDELKRHIIKHKLDGYLSHYGPDVKKRVVKLLNSA
jgi:predicted transcriptional regulator of viral defense system